MTESLAIHLRDTRLGSVNIFVHKDRIKLCWVVQAHTVTDLHNRKSPVQQLSPEVPSQRS